MIQNWNSQQEKFANRKSIQLPEGGKKPIERLCAAYGFTSRQALCRHLGVSQSTMANRVMRGNFPSDWVIICALETGASLDWLVYGNGPSPVLDTPHDSKIGLDKQAKPTQMEYIIIQNGVEQSKRFVNFPDELVPANASSPYLVEIDGLIWIVDSYFGEAVDGVWLIKIDGLISVREVYRLPGERLRVEKGKTTFECDINDIAVIGKIIGKTEFMN